MNSFNLDALIRGIQNSTEAEQNHLYLAKL